MVTQWIAQTQAARARTEAELRAARDSGADQVSRDDIAAFVRANSDLVAVLADTEPTMRSELYERLGLVLTYDSGKQKVVVEMNLDHHFPGARWLTVSVRGGT